MRGVISHSWVVKLRRQSDEIDSVSCSPQPLEAQRPQVLHLRRLREQDLVRPWPAGVDVVVAIGEPWGPPMSDPSAASAESRSRRRPVLLLPVEHVAPHVLHDDAQRAEGVVGAERRTAGRGRRCGDRSWRTSRTGGGRPPRRAGSELARAPSRNRSRSPAGRTPSARPGSTADRVRSVVGSTSA